MHKAKILLCILLIIILIFSIVIIKLNEREVNKVKMKEYLINLWNKIKFDETGALYMEGAYKAPTSTLLSTILKTVPWTNIINQYRPTPIKPYQPTVPTSPYLPYKTPAPTRLEGMPLPTGQYTTPSPIVTQPSLTNVITGGVTQPYTPPYIPPIGEVLGEVTGGTTSGGGGGGVAEFPQTPDILAGLSDEDIARLEREAGNLSELGFAGAFRQLGQNLIESKRIATEEKAGAIPVYEKSMRDVAATVANAIGNWAQKLNQLGMLRSGSYGRGISRLETAGVAERGGLQQALNERLENISTRSADYERDVLDLRAGLEKEKGLNQSTTFERLKREELVYQRDTRQMAFQNEVQKATFVNTMNQMIWQREMSEKQLAAQLEAQSLENQMLKARIASLYGAGTAQAKEGVQVSGVGTLTPSQAIEYGYAPYGEHYTQDPIVKAMMEALGVGGGAAPTAYTPGFATVKSSAAGYLR